MSEISFGPELARSWLLVNAATPDRFAPALNSVADVVLIDIEDAVAPANKDAARQTTIDFFAAGHTGWVRMNGHDSEHWEADCAALSTIDALPGVMLAMVDNPDAVLATAERLPGKLVVALVETALGVQNLAAIAGSGKTFRLAFGLGDFRRDTGFADAALPLAHTRSQFTIASKAAGLPGAIDGPAVGALGAKLADAASVTADFGMTGKLCLIPEQAGAINEILSPSVGDMSWALEFLDEFADAGGQIRNGSDLPRLARANKILALAQAFGQEPPIGYRGFPAPSDTYHY